MRRLARLSLAASLGLLAMAATAAPRTFVASWGNDTNPCSRSLPCRSFATAIANTDVGGEVVVVDSGGYGPFTVNKSLSVVVPDGVHSGITVNGGVGVDVDIGAADVVVLRGLALNVMSDSLASIKLSSQGALVVDRCTLNGNGNYTEGIFVSGAPSPQHVRLAITNTTIRGFKDGLRFRGVGMVSSFPADVSLEMRDSSFVEIDFIAINLGDLNHNAQVDIQGSVAALGRIGAWIEQNSIYGVGQMNAVLDDNIFAFNSDTGILVQGYMPGHPRVTFTGNVIVGNDEGLFVAAGTGSGDVIGYTRLDNTMRENGSNYLQPPLGPAPPL